MSDWNPTKYDSFRDLRLRPALDLLAQVPDVPAGDVIDLGCGSGAVGPALSNRYPDRRLVGVDQSPAMLAKARQTGVYDRLITEDAALWEHPTPPALIFSNALIHWLPDHDTLLPRLVAMLPPGGVLAVQMPDQHNAPSHALSRDIAAAMFPDRFSDGLASSVAAPGHYLGVLEPLGRALVWQTTYQQVLAAAPDAHPVRRFTESTVLRRIFDRISDAEAPAFLAAYDTALAQAYPLLDDGRAILPFSRLFLVVQRPLTN